MLIGDVHQTIATAPGRVERVDHEYVRNGVAEIFLEMDLLTGKRNVMANEQCAMKD